MTNVTVPGYVHHSSRHGRAACVVMYQTRKTEPYEIPNGTWIWNTNVSSRSGAHYITVLDTANCAHRSSPFLCATTKNGSNNSVKGTVFLCHCDECLMQRTRRAKGFLALAMKCFFYTKGIEPYGVSSIALTLIRLPRDWCWLHNGYLIKSTEIIAIKQGEVYACKWG